MLLIALVSALLVAKTIQQGGKDPVKDVCRRHLHLTCVVDSKLYIYGGFAYYGDGMSGLKTESNTYLLWEDLSNAENTTFKFPVQYSNGSIDDGVPVVSGGTFWPDPVNKIFYLYGGEHHDVKTIKGQGDFTLWYYDTIYDKWDSPSADASAVSDDGTAYYYGGYLTNSSDLDTPGQSIMQSALISYNMDSRVWKNDTGNTVLRAEGSLQFLPASDRGMLVYFGGTEAKRSGEDAVYTSLTDIQLYDIAGAKWYTQTASGDTPAPRRAFCAGVVWAEDKSSYNIYIFGGFQPNGTGFGDLYLLSIPSFQWRVIWPIPKQLVFPGGKGYSSCNVFRESQMMIIGGLVPNTSKVDCDAPTIGGQHNVLLGQENVDYSEPNGDSNWWHAPIDQVTSYRVPRQITELIGGDTGGKATVTAPVGPWATDDLRRLFGRLYASPTRSLMSGRTIPTTSTASASPSGQKKNVGATAGGAVGGVVVLIALIAGVLICLRRMRRNKRQEGTDQPPAVADAAHFQGLEITDKSHASESAMRGSTLASTMTHSPGFTPPPLSSQWRHETHMPTSSYQGSPSPQHHGSPLPHHQSGEWSQHGSFVPPTYQQTYYPPPPDPSTSLASANKEEFAHTSSIQEMPNVRSPANVAAEMADVRSPAPRYGTR